MQGFVSGIGHHDSKRLYETFASTVTLLNTRRSDSMITFQTAANITKGSRKLRVDAGSDRKIERIIRKL